MSLLQFRIHHTKLCINVIRFLLAVPGGDICKVSQETDAVRHMLSIHTQMDMRLRRHTLK
jgi:hypothetical protein